MTPRPKSAPVASPAPPSATEAPNTGAATPATAGALVGALSEDTGTAGRALVGPPPMTEKELQDAVRSLALLLNYHFYHTHNSRKSAPGFPDVCCAKGERLIFAELKADKGKLSAYQFGWLTALRGVPGVEVYEWFPQDWRDGTIERVLSREG